MQAPKHLPLPVFSHIMCYIVSVLHVNVHPLFQIPAYQIAMSHSDDDVWGGDSGSEGAPELEREHNARRNKLHNVRCLQLCYFIATATFPPSRSSRELLGAVVVLLPAGWLSRWFGRGQREVSANRI